MKKLLSISLLFLTSVSFSQTYHIYVSDAGNYNNPPWQILQFDHNGLNPSVFIDDHLNWPQDILFLEDSNIVLISNLGSGLINKHKASNGAYISKFTDSIGGPTRMKIGPDSLLYVLQWNGNGKVRRYTTAGTFVDDFTSVGVAQSIGLDWDRRGNLYVSSYAGVVWKFDTAGNAMGLFIDSNLVGPTNIWFDKNGDLLVVDHDGTAVKRFDSTGTYISDFMSGLSEAEGVAFFPNGNIIIGNTASHSIRLYDSTGVYIKDFISSGAGDLLTPNAIVIHEASLNSVSTQQNSKKPVIYPSIGSEFYLEQKYRNKISSIEVCNMNGIRTKLVLPAGSSPLDLHEYAVGLYVVIVQFNDGSSVVEKIIRID